MKFTNWMVGGDVYDNHIKYQLFLVKMRVDSRYCYGYPPQSHRCFSNSAEVFISPSPRLEHVVLGQAKVVIAADDQVVFDGDA